MWLSAPGVVAPAVIRSNDTEGLPAHAVRQPAPGGLPQTRGDLGPDPNGLRARRFGGNFQRGACPVWRPPGMYTNPDFGSFGEGK